MKIYSRKNFILGLICGLIVIFEWKHYDGVKSILWIGFFLYMMFRAILSSLSKEACEREKKNAERDRKIRAQLLGSFGLFAEYITLGLCVLGVGLYAVLWPSEWGNVLVIICFVAATIFAVWFNARYRELMKQEEENNEETKS